jgi:non-ribosomal peptide synthase protein (TIGR01720 family)
VDRARLPEGDEARPAAENVPGEPRSAEESSLVEIWSQVLGRKAVGIYDNFFTLGGDSILSIQMISRAARVGLHLTPKDIFAHQTIAELAANTAGRRAVTAEQGILCGEVPLLPVQHWFFEQESTDRHYYNQATMLGVSADLDASIVNKCISDLLVHHDGLRMRFEQLEGKWVQTYAPFEENVVFKEVDLSSVPLSEWKEAVARETAAAQSSLNLQSGPVARVVWFSPPVGASPNILLAIHHLVMDAVSWRILLEDLQQGCEALRDDRPIVWGAKTSSLRDWGRALQEYANGPEIGQEVSFWRTLVAENSAQLPADFPEGINRADSARYASAGLTVEETQKLVRELPEKYRTQINEILLSALALMLREWTGRDSTLVDLESHGREDIFDHIDITRTVGWFTSIYPVAARAAEDNSIVGTVKCMKDTLRSIPKRGFGFGLLRYLSSSANDFVFQDSARPQISFNYLGQFDQAFERKGIFGGPAEPVGRLESPARTRGYWLDVNCGITGEKFGILWEYSANIHEAATVQRLADRFIYFLREILNAAGTPEAAVYTPSDFSLVDFNQAQLDEILTKVEFQ